MRISVISNLNNGVGLQRDGELLIELLRRLGHEVNGVQFNGKENPEDSDLNIFLEVVVEQFMPFARRNWVVPNPEWWFHGWDKSLRKFEYVLAKTKHCEQLFSSKANTKFIGWKSRDLFEDCEPKEPRFLHLAGKSQTKNTRSVIDCWKFNKPNADLTIVSEHYEVTDVPRVRCIKHATDEELKVLTNSHRFHLMPSAYEGWGHALHEAAGCCGVVVTTNAPPMNELAVFEDMLIPAIPGETHHAVMMFKVSPAEVFRAVNRVLAMSKECLDAVGLMARANFLAESMEFESNILQLVGNA